MIDVSDADPAVGPASRRRGRSASRIGVGVGVIAIMLAALVAGVWYLLHTVDRDLERIEGAFDIPEAARPAPADTSDVLGPASPGSATGAGEDPGTGAGEAGVTILLAGTDRRSDELTTGRESTATTWLPGAQRSDAILLVRLTADGERAYVVSIPRDSWVTIPGLGPNKVNAAFSLGGPSLYVQTIEQVTQTRVDHLAVVDWAGVERLVDTVGGVELTFTEPVVARSSQWAPGTYVLDGQQVLSYVGERKALPRGDFDRVQRQHAVVRAIASTLVEDGVLGNLPRLGDLVAVGLDVVSVDEFLDTGAILDLARRASGLSPDAVVFATAPTTGIGWEGSQSVVYLDSSRQPGFWEAFRTDSLEAWIDANGGQTTPDVVN